MQIKLELELESGVGGGAKVRANGYGVFAEEELSDAANAIQELRLAAERKSERMDTAYSPRFREEELPATANEHCRAQASLSDAANEQSAVINLLLLIHMERLARQGAFLRRPFPPTHSRQTSLPTSLHHPQCEEDQSRMQPCSLAWEKNQHAKQQTKKQWQTRPRQAMQPKDGGANDVPQHGQTILPQPRVRFPQDEAATRRRPLQAVPSRNLRYHGIRSFRFPQHLFQF